jgi:hypothetical protein
MEEWIKICFNLDKIGSYKKADNLYQKIASSLMSKQILIPSDVKSTAKEAYDDRTGDVKFGTPKQIEIARQLKSRTYLELKDVLEIFEYTVKHKSTHLKNKKSKSYKEWCLYGGDAGKDWSDKIIKMYLPDKYKLR